MFVVSKPYYDLNNEISICNVWLRNLGNRLIQYLFDVYRRFIIVIFRYLFYPFKNSSNTRILKFVRVIGLNEILIP